MVRVGESDGGRGSNGGRVSDGGMREWCGVVEEEEEKWSSPTWACCRLCPFMGAGCHSCILVFVCGCLLFIHGSHCGGCGH